jgi:uncharacterized paraquat-inducible protein A
MRSGQKRVIGIFGIIISIIATTLFFISLKNEYINFPSMFLYFIGIILVIWWFKLERSLNLKLAMGIILTGQIVTFLFGESYIDEDNNFILNRYLLLSIFLIGIGILYFIIKLRKKYMIRQHFSNEVKSQILKKQKYKCASCKKFLNVYDFDHKDNDRSNNSYNNCQALCPICHAIKTRKKKFN